MSKLRDAYHSQSGGQSGTMAVGQTVIWWERRSEEQFYRGVVMDNEVNNNIVTIFLSDWKIAVSGVQLPASLSCRALLFASQGCETEARQ